MRREMDEARARADAVVLQHEINGLDNPFLDTITELSPSSDLYDRWKIMACEALLYARQKLVSHYAWAVPDERALVLVGETGSVVEIGAGGGYWAALLRARGVEVFAYDPKPGKTVWSEKVWTEVSVGWCKPAEKHHKSTLFLCWPAYCSRFAEIAVRRYFRAGGERVAYIGEGQGGCCADDGFFELLEEKFEETDQASIPLFPGLHDYLTVWKRK
jgi:hypothetical protein